MRIETITREGKKFAVLPMRQFKQLAEDAEMLADIKLYQEAKARIDSGEDELIPWSMVKRRMAGESTLMLWREHRGMTQEKLASASGVSRAMIASIESKRKTGSVATYKKLAAALKCDLDDLV